MSLRLKYVPKNSHVGVPQNFVGSEKFYLILRFVSYLFFQGMYEISPYATFSVPASNSRSVTTSTLDYTMQFKTFGHIEDEQHNGIYPKTSGKHSWSKHRYYNDGEYLKLIIA